MMKMSNIEKDIKFIDEMVKEYSTFGDLDNPDYEDTERIYKAIEHILAERKQDKARIQELEEALLKVKDKNTTLFITCRNSIAKQKVKDKIEHYKELQNNYIKKYDEVNDTLQGMINILQELLEDK